MTDEFAAHIQARLEELAGTETFASKPSGNPVHPRVQRTQLPARQADYAEGEAAPIIYWSICGGETGRGTSRLELMIDLVIWTPGAPWDGSADIERLLALVLRMAGDHGFAGYRLDWPVKWTCGFEQERDEHPRATQPHPYYKGRIYFTFVSGGITPRCNHEEIEQ